MYSQHDLTNFNLSPPPSSSTFFGKIATFSPMICFLTLLFMLFKTVCLQMRSFCCKDLNITSDMLKLFYVKMYDHKKSEIACSDFDEAMLAETGLSL